MDKSYRAVVIGTEGNGIVFAKRVDSKKESATVLGEEILQTLKEFEGTVNLTQQLDSADNVMIVARNPENGRQMEYRVIFERE